MRYVNKFDYIVENVAQARAILSKNRITYDNSVYQEILKTTKRDGYTGFITKIVFDLGVDKDDAIEIYYKIKKDLADVGELNKMSKEDVEGILTHDENTKGYEYLFTENHYKVFKVDTFEGILSIGSPAWCLKTKSNWDDYTKTRKGMQFVVIQERFIPREAILLTVPKEHDGSRYESGSYAKMRFGVTVYPSGKMDIFDDSNIQLTFNRGVISNDRYNFIKSVLEKISEYHKENLDIQFDWEEFNQMRDTVIDIIRSLDLTTSYSYIAHVKSSDLDDEMNTFYEKIKRETGMNKDVFLKSMNKFKDMILSDDSFVRNNGYMDILVNEFLTANGEEALPSVPNITTREHALGGYFFDEQEVGDTLIKYSYGYQYTKYGKAGILQAFGNVGIFYEVLARDFAELLIDQQYMSFSIFNEKDISVLDGGETEFIKRISESMTKVNYKDGYKIIINLPRLLRILKELHVGYTDFDDRNHRYIPLEYKTTEELSKQINDQIKWVFKGMETEADFINIPICTIDD
jgi:hypothetical protein